MEERIHRNVIRCQSGSMRAGGAPAGQHTSGLYGDDRFRAAHSACNPGKSSGITEGFEVKEDNVGVLVNFPVLKQVVAGDVRFVPNADKRRDTEAALDSKRKDRQSQGTTLRRHGYTSRGRKYRGK